MESLKLVSMCVCVCVYEISFEYTVECVLNIYIWNTSTIYYIILCQVYIFIYIATIIIEKRPWIWKLAKRCMWEDLEGEREGKNYIII